MTGNEVKLSIVATCRNDDHGGDFMRRLRFFSAGLASQAKRFGLSAEMILVEWNPLDDHPPLSEALDWDTSGPLTYRFIRVPNRIHNRFKNADTIAVHQMIAKNVGVRRAKAPFVLATNVDLLFSNELVEYLAMNRLDENCMYRINRTDVSSSVPDIDIESQLEWCAENVIREHFKDGSATMKDGPLKKEKNGWNASSALVAHTNGSGDFTLLSKMAWERLRGYLELPFFCLHLDGLLCITAVGMGYKETILDNPMRLYHIDHGHGWAGVSFKEQLKVFADKQWLDYNFIVEANYSVAKGEVLEVLNDENWGLIDEDLEETIIG